ncbi:thiosulfate sulfurtransferase [Kordiimonas sediminis]|uniref:Sulfurtransferase n=1 Tax=Kordiimonas sediminis TaxID=1735581 RepID=A0A919E8X0_9PROT|nr:3-mercaptopyruvate sulfurtransferase [Kordiimonas sediminis]GHF25634.1 thiosulfate sulfurtransferase [Kordiimonas sediminis]
MMTPLVSTDWVLDNLDTITVLDASWHMPDSGRNAQLEYYELHIPGAIYFDIDVIANHESSLPHTLPTAKFFAQAIEYLGIRNTDTLVIYDRSMVRSAARAWQMFLHFGHREVYVLDGGLEKWINEQKPLSSHINRTYSNYPTPERFGNKFCAFNKVLEAIDNETQIIDARPSDRFEGTAPEPRPGLRSGHIPGSLNVPFSSLFNEDGTYKDIETLQGIFTEAGLDFTKPVITSCGSGVTACALSLALAILGKHDVTVYDGSWTEWGMRDDLPIETGPAPRK